MDGVPGVRYGNGLMARKKSNHIGIMEPNTDTYDVRVSLTVSRAGPNARSSLDEIQAIVRNALDGCVFAKGTIIKAQTP